METLKQPKIESGQEQHVGAAEVFLNDNELMMKAEQAIAEGRVTTKMHHADDEGYADISNYYTLETDDMDPSYVSEQNKFIRGSIEELPVKDKEALIKKVTDSTDQKLKERIFYDHNWYMNEPAIIEEIEENTPVIQRYEIELDDKSIEIINFSESEITPEQLDSMRNMVSSVLATAGPVGFEAINAIIVQSSSRFGDIVAGSARGISGVIRLNEKLINGGFDNEYVKFTDIHLTPLESVLTHELAHLVELKDEITGAYAKETGWKEQSMDIVDDYGSVQQKNLHKLDTPWEIEVSIDGWGEIKNARSTYSAQEITAAKPVTRYGYTNPREDLAEAFVPFVHAKNVEGQLDNLRKDALNRMMQRINAPEHGPRLVSMKPVELSRKIGDNIEPRTYSVSEPVFSYAPGASSFKQRKLSQQELIDRAYRPIAREVTDDYGNVVPAVKRAPSNW